MKNILLLVHDDAGQESRLQAALDLARALRGHLVCLDVAIIPIIVSEFHRVGGKAVTFKEEEARERKNREDLEARLAREDVSWSWIDQTGDPAASLREQAGLADVIVVSRRLDSELLPDTRRIVSEVVVGVDKAVVAVPEHAEGLDVAGQAMIAWDGSQEATKALRAAVPLLKLARTVTIVEIGDGPIGTPARDAAVYLSRHGVEPVVVQRRASSLSTADALLAEAMAEGASYIVMGAFGRSRLVEALFGGVSREMLTKSSIPLVMAH